ncbi:MAG: prepilin-type N-terminal cleavage/methylation domain-containing protein [Lactobacillales bacterium]|nr:prepilin-type N-terminal cleavage/methylation domain-containing protein [Lactobacillales bacterium]
MKNKKGFTLIELLAVIVILAIIALIATPIILNMINDARKSAAADSAYGYIEAIEYNNSMEQLSDKYDLISSGDVSTINNIVKVKGTKPTSGNVTIEKGRVVAANLCIDGFSVIYNGEKVTEVTKSSECGSSSSKEETVYKDYEIGELVWFDPVTYKYCKEGDDNCYSWIVLNNNKEKRNLDLIFVKDESSLQWNKDLLTILNEYTSTWSDKLFVDSNYNLETYFDYSNSKARVPLVSEMSDIIHNKLNEKGSCGDSSIHCLMANTGTGHMTHFWYVEGQMNSGDMMPFSAVATAPTNFYIHPVINIGAEKNVEPEEVDVYVSQKKTKYENGDIIYLDPTDLTKKCTAKNSISKTNEKIGCMKWYAFLDSESSEKVKLILGHNTTETIVYTSDNASKEMKEIKTEIDKLVLESKWQSTPRLITADEIVEITGAKEILSWDSETAGIEKRFDLDIAVDSSEKGDVSKHAWLFNNTLYCLSNGCEVEDNKSYTTSIQDSVQGYWTSTPIDSPGNYYIWVVSNSRMLTYSFVSQDYRYGIRPVIEVNKSDIQ